MGLVGPIPTDPWLETRVDGAEVPLIVGFGEGRGPRLDSLLVRFLHQARVASASTTTGSDISTVAARCMAWSPGEPRARTGDPGGRAAQQPLAHLPSRSLGSLGAGSDYAPFIHFLGISSMDIAYTYDRVSSTPSVSQPDSLLHQSGCSSAA